MPETTPHYKDLLLMLSKEAGKVIQDNFSSEGKKRWKEYNTPITETELRLNYLVNAFLAHYFPEHTVLGEENSSQGKSDYLWVCDPIDGTVAYSHDLPICAFSLALIYKNEVIVSSIYDPFLHRFFYAEKGQGAFLNNQPIRVNSASTLHQKVIGIVGGHMSTLDLGALYNDLRKEGAKVINLYSTLYMSALVASGDLTATVFGGKTIFDTAAAQLLVTEAGGTVTNLQGETLLYQEEVYGQIASNGQVHPNLLTIIQKSLL